MLALTMNADEWIHQPHKAPTQVLHAAGVELGRTYAELIANHAIAREVAMAAYARINSRESRTENPGLFPIVTWKSEFVLRRGMSYR